MRYRRKLFKLKLRPQTLQGIFSLGLVLTAGLLLLSLLAPKGPLLSRIHTEALEQLSWGSVFVAITVLQIAGLFSHIKSPLTRPNSIIGLLIITISLLGVSQAGKIGTGLYRAISEIVPLSLGVFLVFTVLSLFGLTILLNLSLGEAIDISRKTLAEIKKFFQQYLRFPQKSASIFVKDNSSPSLGEKPVIDATAKIGPGETGPGKFAPAPSASGGTQLNLGTQIIENAAGEQIIWDYPDLGLLSDPASSKPADRGDIKHNAHIIEKTLESFGITARVSEVNGGPAITQYALEIALGTKLSKITSLQNDLALALAAPGQIRIEAPIPGRSLVGVEIPNRSPELVPIRKILEAPDFKSAKSKLVVALGLDVSGKPVVADITKMPHCLIAGSTGSGKSVCINSFLVSLLYRNSPNELKLIMVDPKRVELSLYNNIPHLMTPVIVDLEKVLSALKWAISEMDRRYKTFAGVGVRNIEAYNEMSGFQALPYIVIVIDEMADLMMFAPVEVEDAICRIAQMARATGIHLVLSTQRPSVDVITGLIKANIPCRIAFNVTSMVDSRVIIDTPGAEKLIGRGDMLYIPADQSKPSRIQGTWVSEKEVHKVVGFLKSQGAPMQITEEITTMPLASKRGVGPSTGNADPLLDEAIRVVTQNDRASASLLQRKLSVGYARAARLLDVLQELGIVGPGEGSKPRDVLIRNVDEYFAQRNQQTTISN